MRRILCIAVCLLTAGCGLGPGDDSAGDRVQLRVTRDFGQRVLTTAAVTEVRESDTVMRLLQSKAKTTTRYGGGFVQSIDGLEGRGSGGRSDWFYFVNGIESSTGAAERRLSPGDVVQWDYRRWDVVPRVPAIVGAFPEPFLHGHEGKRYPTRVECGESTDACEIVRDKLQAEGVLTGSGSLGAQARGSVLRLQVGRWEELSRLQELDLLEQGPRTSGVFARFGGDGQLALLDARGRTARTAPPGTGLIATVVPEDQQPLWVVTGVDEAGVERAAEALTPQNLRDSYAIAVLPSGAQALPVGGGR